MAYNSQWHMWLPVNDQGVMDQAALQAYEKDKGRLDQGSLSQGMGPAQPPDQDLTQLQIEAFELRVNPFTGEPVTDDYAKMMISSLKWSQIVAGIGMVTGSVKSGEGPYKGRGTSAALDKVKQTIRDAKAKREKGSKSVKTGDGANIPTLVYSRINVRNGDAKVKGSGLNYALGKHGGVDKPNKSQFSISSDELKKLLQTKQVVSSPVTISPTSGDFVR
ncbi:hypothetical protein DN757_25995 [Paenibacillus silvae]|uniref:Pre-toxin TG domain-containing protein n=2 Tax=Paenibacillus silvae TaxID=1325358 RepID=A0A2W6N9U5_9BACL|nr:hypothetical protein DN757_25995 [Paenibacillus silvae]